MSDALLLEFTDAAATRTAEAGGKGASLARLTQGGFPVPPGIVVPAAAYRAFLAAVPEVARRAEALSFTEAERLHAECAEIRALLLRQPLPEGLRVALRERLPALLERGPVSVRSSATLEDLAGAAFAGQHDTYLNVAGVEAVTDAVRRCFASLWEDRAVRYRHEKGFAAAEASMAVVVQTMVQSEVAGVAFSINPVSGAVDEILVNAAYGLGETVVSGEGGVDQWVLEKTSGTVRERAIAAKTEQIVGTAAGTERVPVPRELQERPALDDAQLARLAELVRRAERFYGFPQDVEWALAAGELYLLQSRPVTTFPARWTRDESAERFPNPVTPLTWDFTTEGFHASLAHSLRLMGFPPFEGRWFERFDGYVYGNQTAVQLFTAGLQVGFASLEELEEMVPSFVRDYRWVQELPVTWARDLDRYLLGLGRLEAVDLAALSDAKLWRHVLAVDALGREYFLPNIAISITHGILHRTLFRLCGLLVGAERAAPLYDRLTRFCETKTNLVNADLHRLARLARATPALAARLSAAGRRALWEGGALQEWPEFAAALGRFLQDHGHREVDFDAYHPTWAGQPWVVLENLRLMAEQPELPDPAEREVELRARQAEAEREYLAAAPERIRNFATELLRLARVYTSLDDLEHYQTTRLSPPFRAAIVALGERLVRRGVLPRAEEVFFLQRATLAALAEPAAPQPLAERHALEAAAEAEARANREAYERQQRAAPPQVWGEAPAPAGEGLLRGLPGSPGVAQGPVVRVHGVDDFARFHPGAVLVARTTNPAWTPLFYSAAAVVTESGGPLSHGAVTAREVGIPAVMAAHGALAALADGQVVRVNGTAGVVGPAE